MKDIEAAIAARVDGTPMFVIGRTNGTEDRRPVADQRRHAFAVFEARIKQLLEPAK